MSARLVQEMPEVRLSKVACQNCRIRKVKCSKELPRCLDCQNCQQTCSYPSEIQKPGPKLGSVHKRRRLDNHLQERSPRTPPKRTKNKEPRKEQSQRASPIPEPTIPDNEAQLRSKHIQSVSFLIDASHKPSAPESVWPTTPPTDFAVCQNRLISTCNSLGVTPDSMKQMIEIFFRTFTTFRLFREPFFFEKLLQISCDLQAKALLAAVFAFACKSADGKAVIARDQLSGSDFGDLAISYVDSAIAKCGDDPPPLCLLQALILVTHWLIIKGVRGKAWRYLGLCIRIAFELGLHSVDAGKDTETYITDVEQWCDDEERRRAYWAIWEMDQFANILKQVPMIINWNQNQVFLPAEDERWFQAQPHQSCILEPDFIARSRAIQATGSESAKAWYIVINSLVGEAYTLAGTSQWTSRASKRRKITSKGEADRAKDLENLYPTLFNAIQLCLLVLPPKFKFHGQHLDFGTRTFDQSRNPSILHHQSSIYLINLMPEIARVLALRRYVFEAYVQRVSNATVKDSHRDAREQKSAIYEGSTQELEQCFNACDAILNIEINCNEIHCQYVNPYIAHGSWVAATVQLLRMELTEDESEKRLINSKFEVLKATNDRFVQHWEMSTVPKQNLDDLAVVLKRFTAVSKGLADGERAAGARLKNPVHVNHSSNNEKDPEMHADKYWHRNDTSRGDDSRWNSNLMSGVGFVSSALSSVGNSISPSVDQNSLDTQYHYQRRSVTDPQSAGNTLQQPDLALATGSGFEDPNLSLFCQNQKLSDSTTVLDPTSNSWNDVDSLQAQAGSLNSDLDWLPFSTNVAMTGGLSDYLDEVFSGYFIG